MAMDNEDNNNMNNNYGKPTSTSGGNFRYLIVKPQNGGIRDLVRFAVRKDKASGAKFLESSDDAIIEEELFMSGYGEEPGPDPDRRWVIFVSIIVRKIIATLGKPMEWIGYLVEFILNLVSLNGSFLGLFYNFVRGNIVMPQRGSETFVSAIGHLDGRIDLYSKSEALTEAVDENIISEGTAFRAEVGSRTLMDLCIMASKLAYENEKVVKNVVDLHWKMHFVDFYNCWNEYQNEHSTQVFILCDKPKDANLILISFRGTEPFDADDWSTDFDYSWYEIPKLGKVHMGFFEALGLGNRVNVSTFQELLLAENVKSVNSNGINVPTAPLEGSELSSSFSDSDTQVGSDQSSDPEQPPITDNKKILPVMGKKKTAYYAVKSKLKKLLQEHKNAKFVVTGHSLGGALAILFPTVLVLQNEEEVLQKLLAVYTYGQPRVGNRELGRFMEAHLDHPVPRYFRVVYCNDLVPRLPYDNQTFLYKHFGECLYYDSFYIEQKVEEEPNRNFFGLRYLFPEYLNAVWELIRGFLIAYTHGREYKEGWESILLRVIGLGIPGISAHSPVDYVNSVRLGRERVVQMSSL